ncbi:MAG TPA: hypothetical protein VGK67_27015 [Myxococcales bacterium]|jgi:hypothetical protein
MSYSLLRIVRNGVVLSGHHRQRLGLELGSAASIAFAQFARESGPGVWSVRIDGERVVTEPRAESRLTEGMATRFAVSPVSGLAGAQPKPGPGGVYDPVREPGVATLLTSADGTEFLEACVAAVVGWDGMRIVCVPAQRPRVWSCAEQAIREHLEYRERPLRVDSAEPLLLVNAVKGSCEVAIPGRAPFPPKARAAVDSLFAALTVWPAP